MSTTRSGADPQQQPPPSVSASKGSPPVVVTRKPGPPAPPPKVNKDAVEHFDVMHTRPSGASLVSGYCSGLR